MNRLKTILVVLGLLFIGFVSGFYVHRQMSRHFIKNVMEMRQPKGFQEHFFNRLNASEEQRGKLQPIVSDYGAKIAEEHRAFREKRHALMDSMHADIKPILTAEQFEEVEHFSRRFRERGKKRKKRGQN